MKRRQSYRLRALTAGLLCLAFTLNGSWVAQSTYALTSGCRSDPVVVLSNGAIIDISAAVQTDRANVEYIAYTLHIPQGIWVVSVVGTGLLDRVPSTFAVRTDAPANQYWTETTAYTRVSNVEVAASSALVLATHIRVAQGTSTGREQQVLRVDLQR